MSSNFIIPSNERHNRLPSFPFQRSASDLATNKRSIGREKSPPGHAAARALEAHRPRPVSPPLPGTASGSESELMVGTDAKSRAYTLFLADLIEASGGDREAFLNRMRDLCNITTGQPPAVESSAAPFVGSITSGSSMSAELDLRVFTISSGETTVSYTDFRAQGRAEFFQEVVLENGERFRIAGFVEFEVRVQTLTVQQALAGHQQSDPIALDLDGDGIISLSSWEDGLLFDIDGNGELDRSAFVQGADVFLALDRNGNGRIDDGKELFGDQHGAANGFLELALLDENGDGMIDQSDSLFSKLVGVRRTEDGLKMFSLAELEIAAISLSYRDVDEAAPGGNRLTQTGSYRKTSGEEGLAADLMLNYRTLSGTVA